MRRAFFTLLLLPPLGALEVAATAATPQIDRPTLDKWSAPYRGWHYWPEPVVAADPKIPGHEPFRNPDVPCVYQLPGQPDKWLMSFIAFDGTGYNSFVAESADLVHWTRPKLAMGFGPPGEFDFGGCVIGAFLYESYDAKASRLLKKRDGKYWSLYGCYPRQGGYELRPGYEGVAVSDDGLVWRRAKDRPILSVHDADCLAWEKSCIYQPWLVEHQGRFFNFYNAAQGGTEQMGLAFSDDLLHWKRHPGNPVLRNRPDGYDARFCSDGKVFRDADHWTMLYFGVGRGGAHIMVAFSRDLLHWTAHPEPLYAAGGHPRGLDKTYAHKISLVYNPRNDTFYMHYCATGNKGRCIGLITSRPIASPSPAPPVAGTVATIIDDLRSESPAAIEREITVPPFGIEHQVRLSLDARIDWKTLAGSNPWIRVAINGNLLTKPDLLNKRDEFRLRNGMDITWSKIDRWRVLYSPDFERAKADTNVPNAPVNTDPYRYVWNITPYVQPGKNRLRIDNLQVLAKPTTLVLRNVRLTVGRPISPPVEDAITPAPTGPLPVFVARVAEPVAMDLRLSTRGLIRLVVAGKTFVVHTQTSLPKGQWHATSAGGEEKTLGVGGEAEAPWKTEAYSVRRRVRVWADRVDVADTIANTTDQLQGVMIRHRLAWSEPPKQLRLGGRATIAPTASIYSAEHPSAFAGWGRFGLGLVAVDDVFRVHVRASADPQGMGLSDEQLGIEPGKSATLEWSLYPVPNGDYWDFVNAVRRAWGSNVAIPGPFCYAMHFRGERPAEWYGDWVRRRDLRIVCGGIAVYANGRYAHGTGILHAPQWVAHEKDWTRKMLAAARDVKVLAYFHSQACTEPDGETAYADSRLVDASGEHLGYPYQYRIPLYLPTRDNSYGKALWGFVRTLLDGIGTSGLYWDEMSHSVISYACQAPWDGCTVIINPTTHAVTGRRSSVTLVTQPLYLDIIKHLRERNKFLMANTQPMTRTMLQQKIVRFVETGSYSAVVGTHLGCPLGLGNHHQETTHADSARMVREILRFGGVYYGHIYNREPAEWNFTSVMFPITPAELREGMVLGDERIHTARSGRFGWPDGAPADVYVVNAQGSRVLPAPVRELVEKGLHRYDVRMPGDHFAILVKRAAK